MLLSCLKRQENNTGVDMTFPFLYLFLVKEVCTFDLLCSLKYFLSNQFDCKVSW